VTFVDIDKKMLPAGPNRLRPSFAQRLMPIIRRLRYALRYKAKGRSLKAFIKKRGGVNGVAGLFAARLGRSHNRN
jgi:hypothetical protein